MTRITKRHSAFCILHSAFLAILPVTAQGQQGRQLSLDEALRLAESQSEAVRIAQAGVHRARGLQIVGEEATELIHVGQVALQHAASIDFFIDSIFNFPTLAEAYRVAALDILGQRQKLGRSAAA